MLTRAVRIAHRSSSCQLVCVCVCVYLVGVIRVDEVECARRRAAERGGAPGVRLLGVRGLRRSVGIWQLSERRERGGGERWGEDGRGHGGEAAQAVGHRVRVELDLCVVEVLLAVAAVRVTVTPANRATEEKVSLRRRILHVRMYVSIITKDPCPPFSINVTPETH